MCRYKLAIKQAINSFLGSKNSVHLILADIIGDYSHTSLIKSGTELRCNHGYFIVHSLVSQNWCTGFFCPMRMQTSAFGYYVVPDLRRKTQITSKRLFNPFTNTHVRSRSKCFEMENEPHSNHTFVLY
jgi:hypothetical protein